MRHHLHNALLISMNKCPTKEALSPEATASLVTARLVGRFALSAITRACDQIPCYAFSHYIKLCVMFLEVFFLVRADDCPLRRNVV